MNTLILSTTNQKYCANYQLVCVLSQLSCNSLSSASKGSSIPPEITKMKQVGSSRSSDSYEFTAAPAILNAEY